MREISSLGEFFQQALGSLLSQKPVYLMGQVSDEPELAQVPIFVAFVTFCRRISRMTENGSVWDSTDHNSVTRRFPGPVAQMVHMKSTSVDSIASGSHLKISEVTGQFLPAVRELLHKLRKALAETPRRKGKSSPPSRILRWITESWSQNHNCRFKGTGARMRMIL